MQFLKLTRQRGDTILEVVVAMVLLASILTATFSIINQAINTNVNIKNRIIALNIAREGFEAVRNLRDTNWLKYSGDRRSKWLCRDSSGINACDGSGSTLIDSTGTGEYYTIDYNLTDNRYYLDTTALSEDLDLTSGTQTAVNQAEYRLNLDTATRRYVHDSGLGEPSIFYREIVLRAINPFNEQVTKPNFCDNNSQEPDCFYARLRVESRVHWMEEGAPARVVLEGNLYDFYERKAYD